MISKTGVYKAVTQICLIDDVSIKQLVLFQSHLSSVLKVPCQQSEEAVHIEIWQSSCSITTTSLCLRY